MRNLLLLVIVLFANIQLSGQGIQFRKLTYEEALSAAQTENKMLFVDCYTSWCFPCKMIAIKIFVLDTVGAYFNDNFVSIKLNMEEPESQTLNRQHSVAAYPTFLIFSPEGELIGKLRGASKSADEWLNRIKDAIRNGVRIDSLRRQYLTDKSYENINNLINPYIEIDYKEGVANLLNEKFIISRDNPEFVKEHINTATSYITDPTLPVFEYLYEKAINTRDSADIKYRNAYQKSFTTLYNKYLLRRVEYDRIRIMEIDSVYKRQINAPDDLNLYYPDIIRLENMNDYERLKELISERMRHVRNDDIFSLEKQFNRIKGLPEPFKEWMKEYCTSIGRKEPENTGKKTIDMELLMKKLPLRH